MGEEITEDDFLSVSPDNTNEDEVVEVLDMCEQRSKEFQLASDNVVCVSVMQPNVTPLLQLLKEDVPECVIWNSILSAFHSCTDFDQLQRMIYDIHDQIPPLQERVAVFYSPETDEIDHVAQNEIPDDGPVHKKGIKTVGDGNCLPRSLGKGLSTMTLNMLRSMSEWL